jgi:hypothetical protein
MRRFVCEAILFDLDGPRAARAAGMAAIAVATTHPASELSEAGAIMRTLSRVRLGRAGPTGSVEPRLELLVED